MEHDFWHQKWESDQIGFHQARENHQLVRFFNHLDLNDGARVFVPLCGKTRDIAWLMSQGYAVVGAELSEHAIQQLFQDLNLTPNVSDIGPVKKYSADQIDIFVGDIFDLKEKNLGTVDATFDRAALVALPEKMRERYAHHLINITKSAPQLLLTFEYDPSQMTGPPFSVSQDEVTTLYATQYAITHLANDPLTGGFKGKIPATEHAWLLS